eukprot:6328399-Prymnesium_polylepis.2
MTWLRPCTGRERDPCRPASRARPTPLRARRYAASVRTPRPMVMRAEGRGSSSSVRPLVRIQREAR